MRFLLDQNLRVQTKEFLRNLGHDVVDTRDLGLARATDREIAEVAARENRIIITYNSDFGDIREFPPGSYPGIIRLRTYPQTEEVLHPRLKELLESVSAKQLKGALAILNNVKVRIRRES
jgi:predicted nuclease of predicted toxin-antitoxin system